VRGRVRAVDPSQLRSTRILWSLAGLPRQAWVDVDDVTGEFEIAGLLPGVYQVALASAGQRATQFRRELELAPGQALTLDDCTLAALGRIEVEVHAADPTLLEQAVFEFEGGHLRIAATRDAPRDGIEFLAGDRVLSPELRSGIYRLRVRGEHLATIEREIKIEDRRTVTAEIALEPGFGVSIRARWPRSFQPLQRLDLVVTSESGETLWRRPFSREVDARNAESHVEGELALAIGHYVAEARIKDGAVAHGPFEVRGDGTTTIELDFEPQTELAPELSARSRRDR
jgi:hypothetical protein